MSGSFIIKNRKHRGGYYFSESLAFLLHAKEENKMTHIAMIGAGTIARRHVCILKDIPDVAVAAVCDQNSELAKALAAEFGIPNWFDDYRVLLKDPCIDAVCIATPTFTHGKIVADALMAGKHVFCEKPPALTWQEALENENTARETGKVLMYGFVCRFDPVNIFLKRYIATGRMGDIYYGEVSRMLNCAKLNGWFLDKSKSGGGCLIDMAIHQLDLLLYFMNYPKVISVKGFTSGMNKDLPERIKGIKAGYTAATNAQIPRTVESFATGYITLAGGKNIFVKAAHIANTANPGTRFELLGATGGASYENGDLKLLFIDETDYFMESSPIIKERGPDFKAELQHFVDCCNGRAECICNAHQGTEIIRIINAIYESAETGKEIVFD